MPPWHAQVFGSSVVQTPQPIKRSRGARPSPGRINTNGTPRATGRRRRAANAAQTSGYGAAISGSGAADAAQASGRGHEPRAADATWAPHRNAGSIGYNVRGEQGGNMRFETLREFIIVAKHLNITKAAQELYLSQPSLSARIEAL